ncbi:superoxide dismutase family protein [Bacillus sp. FJAT-49731]|uniref:Superoxide dismutase [Cu-Zn] n=2 Tax=Lederbergia citrea TaxID=2833581 RepID=A0A942URF2_9BACI|nr:superoxide dismutase family protein [Lederbergia citrea]MBS4202683.1 superoxide dismutase family protein [Lederbergia citrea]MBS4222649.1 superoxide dismutase family protein [Lederbergia citrea]
MMILALLYLLGACGNGKNIDNQNDKGAINDESAQNTTENQPESTKNDEQTTDIILVELKNADDKKVGEAQLQQVSEGVLIKLEASDLPPGAHGFHIHETGKCEAPTFESAGGHFNPTDAEHGMKNEKGPHAGDLPNIEVGEDGKVQFEVTADNVTLLADEENSLLGPEGTSLVIHAKPDDEKSQPAGDAGDRIVCGSIGE